MFTNISKWCIITHAVLFSYKDNHLIISIPLRVGRTTIAHHTLLSCSGGECPVNEEVVKELPVFDVGDVVWAKAPYLRAWPGKIISRDRKKASADKVRLV